MSRPIRLGLAAFFAAAAGLACEPQKPAPPADAGAAQEAARFGGQTLTIGELDAHIRDQLFEQASEGGDPAKLYELRSQALEELIDERLIEAEAKARGLSPDDLAKLEAAKAAPVQQADIQKFFDEVKERLPKDAKVETFADQIRARLEAQNQAAARQAFVDGLREKAQVAVALEPPRIEVSAVGAALGPENAPITIVEFSDYECPFCKRAHPTVTEVVKRYPDKVRLVYRHFPLDNMHPNARPAAEASLCAEEQGKFWPYHDLLFASSDKLTAPTLRGVAEKAGLDLAKYDACVKERRHRARVDADVADGRAARVSGTPAFFVNGIPLSGARSVEEFVQIIDRELARAAKEAS
jgi:protein-disulfide isomerase